MGGEGKSKSDMGSGSGLVVFSFFFQMFFDTIELQAMPFKSSAKPVDLSAPALSPLSLLSPLPLPPPRPLSRFG